MSADDLAFAGVTGQRAALEAGSTTSRELVSICLDRINRYDGGLNAFVAVRHEEALAEADAADASRSAGDTRPLLGVPVAVKDNEDVTGLPTRHGSRSPAPPAPGDGPLTAALRAAGAVVVGKTALPELALFPITESAAHGVTTNPFDRSRTSGGSSGGSATAVAAGLVPFATATDGGGSIRVPAACCGIVGLKPTRDTLPLPAEHWYGLSHAGVLTRSVADTMLVYEALTGLARHGDPGQLRIAMTHKAPQPTPLSREQARALDQTAEALRGLGHEVVDAKPPFASTALSFLPRYFAGARDDLRALEDPSLAEGRTKAVARLAPPARVVRGARRGGEAMTAKCEAFLAGFDLLLMPMLARPALPVGRYARTGAVRTLNSVNRWMGYAPAWNVTGQPALALPAGLSSHGLPLAVQLVARRGADALLLAVAATLEQVRPWTHVRPTLTPTAG